MSFDTITKPHGIVKDPFEEEIAKLNITDEKSVSSSSSSSDSSF